MYLKINYNTSFITHPLYTVILLISTDKTKSPSDVQGLNEVDKLQFTSVRLYINELLSVQRV